MIIKAILIVLVLIFIIVMARSYYVNKEAFDDITNSNITKLSGVTNTVVPDLVPANSTQATIATSTTPQRTDIVPQISVSDTGYQAMTLQQRADLLKDIQQVVRNEMLANRSTTGLLENIQQSPETTFISQGKEYENSCYKDTEYRCPKNPDGSCPPVPDMTQYIKKDEIPCWGCSLDY